MHEREIFEHYAEIYSIQVEMQHQYRFDAKGVAMASAREWLIESGMDENQARRAVIKAVMKYKDELL